MASTFVLDHPTTGLSVQRTLWDLVIRERVWRCEPELWAEQLRPHEDRQQEDLIILSSWPRAAERSRSGHCQHAVAVIQ